MKEDINPTSDDETFINTLAKQVAEYPQVSLPQNSKVDSKDVGSDAAKYGAH